MAMDRSLLLMLMPSIDLGRPHTARASGAPVGGERWRAADVPLGRLRLGAQQHGLRVERPQQRGIRVGVPHQDLATAQGHGAQGHLRTALGGPAQGPLR